MSVDAVITWVDGDDPAHRARLEAYLASVGGSRPPAARATRFNDAGEIDYCVASILRFAPWIRTIWILTDAQSPALLGRLRGTTYGARLRLVDHTQVFGGFEEHLPTFNSRTISSLMWKIPGIAERFLFFNDDFMLLRPVEESDFFRGEQVVLRGRWRTQSAHSWMRRLAASLKGLRGVDRTGSTSERHAQELSARLAGFDRQYCALPHAPYAFRRSTMEAFFDAHPSLLRECASHRLRAWDQLRPESLFAHLEFARGRAILDNRLRVMELKPRTQSAAGVAGRMARADVDPRMAFACVQSIDVAPELTRQRIFAWLAGRIGRIEDLPGA